MKTLDLSEAAQFLRMHPDTLQRRAAAGEIPGAKPGKCWVFIDVDLADWLRTHYKTREIPTAQLSALSLQGKGYNAHNPCMTINSCGPKGSSNDCLPTYRHEQSRAGL